MAKQKRTQQRVGTSVGTSTQRPSARSTAGKTGASSTTRTVVAAPPRRASSWIGSPEGDSSRRAQPRPRQRRYEAKPKWYQGRTPIVLSIVSVIVIVTVIILVGRNQSNGPAHNPVASNVLTAIEQPNAAIFDQVSTGTSAVQFKALPITGGTNLPPQNGKPVVFYVGAEYCPYCAENRWPLIMALSRFGTFTGLETNASMAADDYPSTRTFTFVNAKYTSKYIVFDAKEIYGKDTSTPLQSMTSQETAVFHANGDSSLSIPFIDFGGQYTSIGASYDTGVLHINPSDKTSQALSYDDIVSGLSDASNPIAQAVVGTANEYTAAICASINNADQAACSSNTIQQIEAKLPKR